MATTLFHGLTALGVPVVCVESRQAYQALRSLAAHNTDRNDARGLAHLARTGFFKPVHVKSLPSHAVRALLIARKKLVGQRVTLKIRSADWRWRSGSDCRAVLVPALQRRRWPPVTVFPASMAQCGVCSPHVTRS